MKYRIVYDGNFHAAEFKTWKDACEFMKKLIDSNCKITCVCKL